MKTIKVTIDQEGNTEIKTSGFKGSECQKATKDLEASLGETIKEVKTPEFSQPVSTVQGQRA